MGSVLFNWILIYFVINFHGGIHNIGVLGTKRHDGMCSTQLCSNRYHGITKSRCERRNCCWNFMEQDCYEFLEPKCQIEKSKRTTCPGTWYGYTRSRCENKGCCFNEESSSCYQSKPDSSLHGRNNFTIGQVATCGEASLSIDNGKMECMMIDTVYTCTAQCNEQFELSGISQKTCDKTTSRWSSSPWSCEIASCKSFKTTENTFLDCTNGLKIGSICIASCGRGYTLKPEHTSGTAICSSTGEWSSETDWYCIEVQCPELNKENVVLELSSLSPELTSFACTNARKFNSLCEVDCTLGYFSAGTQSVRCGINGKWSDGKFLCLPLHCESLDVADNVEYACTNGNHVGSECQFSCREGYLSVGANTTVCRGNQRWSGISNPIACQLSTENICRLEMDLLTGEMSEEQDDKNIVTVIHPPSLPAWKDNRSKKNSQCDYQSVIEIQMENVTSFSLAMKFEVPRSFHFELSDSIDQDRSIQADGFNFRSVPGIPSQMIFPSKNKITFAVKKSGVVFKIESSEQEQFIPLDFSRAKSVFVGVNRAVNIRHKYDVQRMGSGLCSLCVSSTP